MITTWSSHWGVSGPKEGMVVRHFTKRYVSGDFKNVGVGLRSLVLCEAGFGFRDYFDGDARVSG